MTQEAYVSFEVAKLLKEKGFDWELRTYYNEEGDELTLHDDFADISNSEIDTCDTDYIDYLDIHCTRPTQQMAMRWVREEKKYYIQVDLDGWALGERSGYYVVISATDRDFEAHAPMEQVFFDTPEDAVESALKYVLTNLI